MPGVCLWGWRCVVPEKMLLLIGLSLFMQKLDKCVYICPHVMIRQNILTRYSSVQNSELRKFGTAVSLGSDPSLIVPIFDNEFTTSLTFSIAAGALPGACAGKAHKWKIFLVL